MPSNGQYNNRHNDERRSDLAVLDANEYKQKRRLEKILDSMDDIDETADRAKERYVDGEITLDGRNIMVQDAVSDAIRECWNLLKDHEKKCNRLAIEELTEEDDDPPTLAWIREETDVWPHSDYFTGRPGDPLGVVSQEFEDDIVIYGLSGFLDVPEMWTERWAETVKERGGHAHEVVQTVQHTVPEDVSWAAAIRLKEFLNDEHDLEVQFEALNNKSLPTITGFDQSREEPEAGLTNAEFNRAPDL